jgi:hypothetical protein
MKFGIFINNPCYHAHLCLEIKNTQKKNNNNKKRKVEKRKKGGVGPVSSLHPNRGWWWRWLQGGATPLFFQLFFYCIFLFTSMRDTMT